MKNIVWEKPDNCIATTGIDSNMSDEEVLEFAKQLKQNGAIDSDWNVVGINIPMNRFPSDWDRMEDFRFINGSIVVDLESAKKSTIERLRRERIPLFEKLDSESLQNMEGGKDNSAVIAEKERLRNITETVASAVTIDDLKVISVEKPTPNPIPVPTPSPIP